MIPLSVSFDPTGGGALLLLAYLVVLVGPAALVRIGIVEASLQARQLYGLALYGGVLALPFLMGRWGVLG